MALSVFVAISVLCADKRVWGQGVDCHVSSQTVCKPAVRRLSMPSSTNPGLGRMVYHDSEGLAASGPDPVERGGERRSTVTSVLTIWLASTVFFQPVVADGHAGDGVETVRATGIGRARRDLTGVRARLMAERAAQVVAARNLVAKLQGLSGGSEPPGPPGEVVGGRLAGHRYLPTRYLDDGTAMVTAEVRISPPPKQR